MDRTINVSNADELDAALRAAAGGETIVLAAGDYGSLFTGGRHPAARYDSEVTLVSADPGDPAVFTGMHLRDVANLTVDSVVFDYAAEDGAAQWHRAFRAGGEDLVIRNSLFDGDVARGTGGAGEGYPTGFALTVGGTRVTIENNEFQSFWKGLGISGADMTVRGNEFHTIRSDGLNVVHTDGALIEGNHFHSFRTAPGTGDHADMVQFWIHEPGEETSNVVLRGNLFDLGEGSATQSLFMRNLAYDTGKGGPETFYRNITIEENVVLNGQHHGITVGETDGLVVANNVILQKLSEDFEGSVRSVDVPKLVLAEESTNVTIVGNVAPAIPAGQPGWTMEGNVEVQNEAPARADHVEAVFVGSTIEDGAPVARPGGLADEAGAGLPLVDPAQAMFVAHASEDGPTVRVLDAAAVLRANGMEDRIEDMRFEWRFADGAVAEGPVVSRDFGPGTHDVALAVTRPDGSVSQVEAPLTVLSPVLASVGPDGASGELADALAGHEGGIEMDARGAALTLGGAQIQRAYEAETLRIDMTLSADEAGAHGEVMHLLEGMRVNVTEEGELRVRLFTDGGHTTLETAGARLHDGAAHEVSLLYDRTAGEAVIELGGQEAARAAFEGGFVGGRQELHFGHAWGGRTFDGTVSAFDLEVKEPVRDPYEGDPALIEEARLPVPEAPAPFDRAAFAALEAPSELPEPALPAPIFDLAETGDDGMWLMGDGTARTETGGVALDGTGGSASLKGLRDINEDGDLMVTVTYEQENVHEAARLFWGHMILGLEVEGTEMRAHVLGADGAMQELTGTSEALGQDGPREVTVAVDSALDRIQIVVDDEVVIDETGRDVDIAAGTAWQWMLGTPWSRHFEGEFLDLEIRDAAVFEDLEKEEVDDAALLG